MDPSSARARPAPPAVVTPGNYDGVHLGHRALAATAIARARRDGWRAIGLTFDPHPSTIVAPTRPLDLLTLPERRVELLRGLGLDDVVIQPFDDRFAALEPEAFARQVLVESVGARAIVVGHDFRFGRARKGDIALLRELGERHGFEVIVVDAVQANGAPVSSTRIRDSLLRGDVEDAAMLLARVHDVSGEVVRGDGRGRTLGFATANLRCDPVLLPASGVYAVVARRVDRAEPGRLLGVANLGSRPTFGAGASFEVHVLDFDGDLYGARLRVGFVARLRDEKKFDGIDALRAQIAADVARGRGALARAPEERLRWI